MLPPVIGDDVSVSELESVQGWKVILQVIYKLLFML